MQRKRLLASLAAVLGIVALVPVATALGDDDGATEGQLIEAVTALGTGFTYQGRLTDAGSPANGSYDLRFILYDAETGGAQVGAILEKGEVGVVNGLFSTELDFGASAFTGDALWLEISVRPGTVTGAGGYTVLSPRQPVSPAPYALYAKAAGGFLVPLVATGASAGAPATQTGLVTVTQSGTGIALSGLRTTADAAAYPSIYGYNAGGGAAVQGESTFASGVAVRGFATGLTGTAGAFSGPTALDVDGAIKVSGTNRAAFVHTATALNSAVSSCEPGDHCTVIDNPMTNDDPNAMLFITQRYNEGDSLLGVYNNASAGVWFEPTLNKWVIFNEGFEAMPVGAKFNVLVVKQ